MAEDSRDKAPLYLADGIQVGGSTWSFIMTAMRTRIEGEKTETEPVMTLSISWPLAKALHQMLGPAIAAYEAQEGPLALPKSFAGRKAEVEASLAAKKPA